MKTVYLQPQDCPGDPRTVFLNSYLHIGRGPHNGVVLGTPDVSWSHALLRVEDEQLIVEDLGSRNGTWVDGVRIEQPTPVTNTLRIGNYLLTQRDDTNPQPMGAPLFLEEVETHIRYPLSEGSFLIGDAPGANIRVPGVRPEVLRITNGVVHIGNTVISTPWSGTLGGSEIRIFNDKECWSPTMADGTITPAMQVVVGLEPPTAQVVDLHNLKHHTVTAPNRVSLLFFLAQSRSRDVESKLSVEQQGWRSDEDVAVAVWGRSGRGGPRNRLNTLTYRLRTELTERGLLTPLLDKKPGWLRLVDCDIDLR